MQPCVVLYLGELQSFVCALAKLLICFPTDYYDPDDCSFTMTNDDSQHNISYKVNFSLVFRSIPQCSAVSRSVPQYHEVFRGIPRYSLVFGRTPQYFTVFRSRVHR